MTLKEEIITKMELIRNDHRLTQAQMAEKIGLSLSTYKRIILGTTKLIDIDTIDRIHKEFGINLYRPDPVQKKWAALSARQQDAVEAMIDFELSYSDPQEDPLTVYIPTGNMEDGMIYDSASYEIVQIKHKRYSDKVFCGIRVTSNHLHPVYLQGDILLMSHSTLRDGDVGIFLNDDTGKIYIRKYSRRDMVYLEPINNYGETIVIDPTSEESMCRWHKFGKVITKVRL